MNQHLFTTGQQRLQPIGTVILATGTH